ncbi:oligosaccharide flippase family protein [Klebsiella pneumoniae]|uniref:oligosaccharide flippase family protein n=1 Tax=Klebsiella pneumoniae TaxID=573 RepID=UPI003F6E4E9F
MVGTATASANIFSCFQVVDFWLQSKVNSKYSAILRLSIFITSSLVKLISIIFFSCGLKTILIIQTFEVLASGVLYVPLYKYLKGKIFNWSYNKNKAKTLMSKSWWLILSGVAEVLYLKIDQIMLGMINGYSTVATYAVACVSQRGVVYFPTDYYSIFFPATNFSEKESEETTPHY